MKNLLATTALGAGIVFSATSAMALDPLGAPVSGLKKGQWDLGVEHSQGEQEIRRLLPPQWTGSPGPDSTKHKFDDIRRTAVKISYGISDNIEIFGRVGKAEADTTQYRNNGQPAFTMNGDDDTFWGFGAKAFLCTFEGVKIGLTGQWSTTDYDASGYNSWWGDDGTLHNSIDELQVALGGQTEVSDGITVYAGGVFQQVTGDSFFEEVGGTSGSNRQPLEEDDELGFYVGGSVRVMDNARVGAEYQGVGDDHIWGLSAILTY